MYQYSSGESLLNLCRELGKDIAEIAILAEAENSGKNPVQITGQLQQHLQIMRDSIKRGLNQDIRSIGGLIGGNAYKLQQHLQSGNNICGSLMLKASSYALAVTEVNAAMGRIVAAPTAGASGIIPGILLALQEEKELADEIVLNGFATSGAVGKIIAMNATLSGAEGGCQAECGSASAMAAAAAVYLNGGSPEQSLDAAAMALKGLLGLVCDPVAGLVEVPCSKRNATSAANALACAEMALAGISSFIPFDEIVAAMYKVGNMMSPALRETAGGGCADTETAKKFSRQLEEREI